MTTYVLRAALLAILLTCARPASAITVKEFRKFTQNEQGQFISGAVSMAISMYAVNGKPNMARCVHSWYLGAEGTETAGPREIAVELFVVERDDPEKYQVEGVLLGLMERACAPRTPAK